jgi:hypothetical protein
VVYSWDDPDTQDLWTLTIDESALLLLGMTDKRRLGFAVQLKFLELHGRFPGVLEILCHSFTISFTGVTHEQDYTVI